MKDNITNHTFHYRSQQRGAVLIIGLIMLFSLTILGIGSMSSNLLQQRMASNMGDSTLAFNAADSLLRREQVWLATQADEAILLTKDCNNVQDCIYYPGSDEQKNVLVVAYSDSWWDANAILISSWWDNNAYARTPSINDLVYSDPRIVIERRQFEQDSLDLGTSAQDTGITYYRFTARGTGSTDFSEAVLQTTVSKRWN